MDWETVGPITFDIVVVAYPRFIASYTPQKPNSIFVSNWGFYYSTGSLFFFLISIGLGAVLKQERGQDDLQG